MRVGILTLHSGANYGGTLQCVALFNVLRSIGADVQVINYIPKLISPLYKRILYKISAADFYRNPFTRSKKLNKNGTLSRKLIEIFDEYRNSTLRLTKLVDENSIAELNGEFDLIIVGSDQVWSSFVRSKLTYFGDWEPNFTGQMISYAACATNDNYPIIRKNKLKTLLNRFNDISVRDDKSKEVIKRLMKREIPIVLDPTFLYDFNEIEETESLYSFPYILVYVLGKEHTIGNDNIIDAIRQKLNIPGLQVIAVTTDNTILNYANHTLVDVSPLDWLKLIKHAEYVFTDSFHASVFSMKYRTPVLAYYTEKNRASRLIDLFNKTNMNDSLFHDNESLNDLKIDFSDQYSKFIDVDKTSSLSFLKKHIQ